MSNRHSSGESSAPEPLFESVSLVSKKWHPAIVRSLAETDGLGYSDLQSELDGISAKVLTDALSELEKHQIIDREEVSQRPLRVNYRLTDRGEELDAIIGSLADWGESYLTGTDTEQVVLVADDDERFLLMHETWLEDEYTVRTVSDGDQVLQQLDSDVGVVILDRRMPGLSGDEVLDWIRSQRDDIRVVMVTAEEPGLDIHDMPFDEYLTKPVFEDDIRAVVAEMFERREYGTEVQAYLAIRSKLAILEAENPPEVLEGRDEYERLQRQLEHVDAASDDVADAAPETVQRFSAGRSS